jgi:nucleoside-diphosphate-sugar epimerase
LRTANYVLPKGGLLSPVYVDDVVHAIILAATKIGAMGQRYIISGPETVDWIQFYQAYTRMGTKGRVFAVGDDEYAHLVKERKSKASLARLARLVAQNPDIRNAAKENSFLIWSYNLAKRLLPRERLLQLGANDSRGARGSVFSLSQAETPAAFLPGAGLWKLYKSPSRYSVDKAKHELGYRPQTDLKRGMELTAEWARWARLT